MARLIDAENYRNLFNEEFKKTMELIRKGETHLDTLAEGFTEADRVIRALPTIDPVTAAAEALGMSPDRLRELAQAEKEGRLVVLPCKDWFEIVFGEQELFWGIDTDYIETPIREISVDNAERFTWYDGWKTLVLRGNDENGLDWEFSPEDIGKTVFLTREAAEAALEEKECTK